MAQNQSRSIAVDHNDQTSGAVVPKSNSTTAVFTPSFCARISREWPIRAKSRVDLENADQKGRLRNLVKIIDRGRPGPKDQSSRWMLRHENSILIGVNQQILSSFRPLQQLLPEVSDYGIDTIEQLNPPAAGT